MANPNRKYFIEKEKLIQWYEVEKRSYRWIMAQIGCNSSRSIKTMLIEYEIPIRHGSDAVATQWINNEERRRKTGELCKKSFEPFRGTPHSDETKKKIGIANCGEKNGMWGKFGDLNPAYLGGKKTWSSGRKIENKKRKEIFEQLGNKCFNCGTDQDLTIHHDPPWRVCRSHDIKFLKILCKKCHFNGPNHKR